MMKKITMTFMLVIVCLGVNAQISLSKKGTEVFKKLTLEEKVKLCYGNVTESTTERFNGGGIERLNIKQLEMLDGPVGVRNFDPIQKTTALPSTLSLSCTWDKDAAKRYSTVLGDEMSFLKKNVLFGPGLNMMRSPLGGRNFEYMGEDPYLTGVMGVNYIQALQKLGIAACAKHYVANEADYLRHFTSSNMDERTLREVYLLPFEMAVKQGHVWTVMTANSLYNGVHASENKYILQDILKNDLGFDGVVLTDWRAAYDTKKSAIAGTDMTTGFCAYVFGDENGLLAAVKKGEVDATIIDDKVKRILNLYDRVGLLNEDFGKNYLKFGINSDEHKNEARKLAAEGMVLLKNENKTLPLKQDHFKNIIVTGPGAQKVAVGTGSSLVNSEYSITPLQGIKNAFPNERINFHEYKKGIEDSIASISQNDIVLYFALGNPSGEGNDLKTIDLSADQIQSMKKLASKCKKMVVVVQSAGPVGMFDWNEGPEAILSSWYAGQSTGDAIADVLFGKVNPGGKLNFTIAKNINDYACHNLGLWPQKGLVATSPSDAPYAKKERVATHGYDFEYKEGVFVGYRWFDKQGSMPLYPFGFGLSYTTFSIEKNNIQLVNKDAKNPIVKLSVKATNTGTVKGSEVIQVYIEETNSILDRPKLELKGFEKVVLEKGETKVVEFSFDKRSFAYWDIKTKDWNVKPGVFKLHVGNSSRDIKFIEEITLR